MFAVIAGVAACSTRSICGSDCAGPGGMGGGGAGRVDASIAGPSGAGLGGAAGWADYCGITRTAAPLPADVLILLNRSASMANDIEDRSCTSIDPATGGASLSDCGPNSKWALVTPAIQRMLSASDGAVNWGLKLFADPGDASCSVSATVQVPPAAGNGPEIAAALAAETNDRGSISNGSRTPVQAAVTAAITYFASQNDLNPKYILLATDGLPDCSSGGTSATGDDSAGAIQAIQTAFNNGIATFVLGIAIGGMETADATLSQMAVAGGVPRAGSPAYYPASTAADVTSALRAVVDRPSCLFSLGPPPSPDGRTSFDSINVFVDNVAVQRDTTHTEGWDYSDASHRTIVLSGAVCAAFRNRTTTFVTVRFNCLDV